MSMLEDEPEWAGDPEDASPLSSDPKHGVRVRAERAFIEMCRAAFYGHDTFPYHPDEGKGRLQVRSTLSQERLDQIPRIETRIGPLEEHNGSIDNLKEWDEALQRHMYVDKAQIAFVCTAELETEASDLGERVRRVLDLARPDLGRRGIFGLQNPSLKTPQPARPETEDADVYQSVVSAPFLAIERQERRQTGSVFEQFGYDVEFTADSDTVEDETFLPDAEERSEESPATPAGARVTASPTGHRLVVTFSDRLGTYQVKGISARIGTETIEPPAVRNSSNFFELFVDLPEVSDGTPVAVSYAPGNLRDDSGRPVASFGPLSAQ